MRIYKVVVAANTKGLDEFTMDELGEVVVLAGENGSGKTRLLKLIEESMRRRGSIQGCTVDLVDNEVSSQIPFENNPFITNYSHSDLPLQSPNDFPPYVINISKQNLGNKELGFEQTAHEALLYLTYLTKYASAEELNAFNDEFCEPLIGERLVSNGAAKEPRLFKVSLTDLEDKAPLSPGQKYLLRLCVALSCSTAPEGAILFLDEPESHLHPKALLELINKLKNRYRMGQIWIATHSMEIMSHFWYQDIWYLQNNKATKMGSKTEKVLSGVLGDENKRYLLYQFISSPDAYACNAFAVECLTNPEVLGNADSRDPSAGLAKTLLQDDDVVIDFGAGKGRFLNSFCDSANAPNIEYYAYDKYGYLSQPPTADDCKTAINQYIIKYRKDPKVNRYFGSEEQFDDLRKHTKANKVLLINVLHEIAPKDWPETFCSIDNLLENDGQLIVVEREELTIGEKPYDSDFFVINPKSLESLLHCSQCDFSLLRHPKSEKVVAYTIPKNLLGRIDCKTVGSAIASTIKYSEDRIIEIKRKQKELAKDQTSKVALWEYGISLAFWTHQFANASLYRED